MGGREGRFAYLAADLHLISFPQRFPLSLSLPLLQSCPVRAGGWGVGGEWGPHVMPTSSLQTHPASLVPALDHGCLCQGSVPMSVQLHLGRRTRLKLAPATPFFVQHRSRQKNEPKYILLPSVSQPHDRESAPSPCVSLWGSGLLESQSLRECPVCRESFEPELVESPRVCQSVIDPGALLGRAGGS